MVSKKSQGWRVRKDDVDDESPGEGPYKPTEGRRERRVETFSESPRGKEGWWEVYSPRDLEVEV